MMKRILLYILSITAFLSLASAVFFIACSSSSTPTTSTTAAEDGLATLRNMANGDDFAFFGYTSESEVGSEVLGDPLEVKELDIDALLATDTPTDSLIIETNEFLFPVLVNGVPIQAISVELMDDEGEWEYIETESNVDIEKALEIIAANSLNRDDCFLLDLEQIELVFVGYSEGGRIMLIPLYSNTTDSFVAGTKYVFTEIAPQLKTEILAAEAAYADMIPSDTEDISAPINIQPSSNPALKALGKTGQLLNVSLISQEEDQWCWAATGRMTMLFAGGDDATITQCAQANSAFSQSSCCVDGSTTGCNKPYRPRYDSWGFSATKVYNDGASASLAWEDFKTLIDAGKPVAFLWRWRHGGGHYMVAVGYYEDTTIYPAIQMVLINNPWPPNIGKQEAITYAKWVGGPRYNNLQTCYFYDITKN